MTYTQKAPEFLSTREAAELNSCDRKVNLELPQKRVPPVREVELRRRPFSPRACACAFGRPARADRAEIVAAYASHRRRGRVARTISPADS